jgi:hypothetical protein
LPTIQLHQITTSTPEQFVAALHQFDPVPYAQYSGRGARAKLPLSVRARGYLATLSDFELWRRFYRDIGEAVGKPPDISGSAHGSDDFL